ncbi:hypothetical protein Tco_0641659 [Tanacetum coccineum]
MSMDDLLQITKVKKLEGFLKRRNMVLSDSEGEEPEAQGRKSQDDPLDSLVQGLFSLLLQKRKLALLKQSDWILYKKKSSKDSGEELPTKTSKRLKSDEAKDVESTKKSRKRRKQIKRKGLHKDLDKDDSEDSDEVGEQEESVTESMDVYMLIERQYPLSAEMCKAMLDKKLQGGKQDENCYKMLKMMEKQAGI